MPYEPSRGMAWLYQRLSPDPDLRGLVVAAGNPAATTGEFVYKMRASATARKPYIILNEIGTDPSPANLSQDRIWVRVKYWVSLWTPTASDTVIEPIMDRIEALLPKTGGPILDGYVVVCERTDANTRPSDVAGDTSVQTYLEYALSIRVP